MTKEKALRVEELAKLMKDGDVFERDKAYEELVSEVMFYIRALLNKYFSTYCWSWYEDLCQEGYLAVCECLPKFDYTRAKSLTTYVKPYVMHRVTKYISTQIHNRTAYYSYIIRVIEQAEKELDEDNTPITSDNIHELTGLSKKIIDTAADIRIKTDTKCGLDKIGESYTFTAPSIEDQVIKDEKDKAIRDALLCLTDEERLEVECFFGFRAGGKGAKFAQKVMGIDAKRQNTIHVRAVRRLKNLKNDQELMDILGL